MAKFDFQPHWFPALSLPHHRWVALKTCDMLLLTFMLAAWVMAMPWLMANRKSFWLRWCGRGCTFEVGRCFLLWDPWDGEVGNATNGNGRVGSNWYSRSHRKLWQESKADTQGNPPVRYAPPLPKRRVRGGMRPRKNRRGQSTQCGACWKLELRSPSTRTIPRCSLPL